MGSLFLQQHDCVGDGGIFQFESFGRFCFQAYAIVVHMEQLRHAGSDDGGVGADLGRGQNQAGIKVGHAVTRALHALERFAQEDDGIRAFPFWIRWRKQRTDIGRGDRPEQRVGNGVQQDIAVRVPA